MKEEAPAKIRLLFTALTTTYSLPAKTCQAVDIDIAIMVIGLLTVTAIPTIIGVCEALSAQKKVNAAAKEKTKFHLLALVSLDGKVPIECWCVLVGGRLWLDHPQAPIPGHKFTGYYFAYPSEERPLGLVSTIADDPPMLNWIFVDRPSLEVRHGGRQATLGHIVGPWYWSDDEQQLTLEGDSHNFVAVEMVNGRWVVAYDPEGKIRRWDGGGEGDSSHDDEDDDTRSRGGGASETSPALSTVSKSEKGKNETRENQAMAAAASPASASTLAAAATAAAAPATPHEAKDDRKEGRRSSEHDPGDDSGDFDGTCGGTRTGNWVPIRLYRKMQFGMESRYVKDKAENEEGE